MSQKNETVKCWVTELSEEAGSRPNILASDCTHYASGFDSTPLSNLGSRYDDSKPTIDRNSPVGLIFLGVQRTRLSKVAVSRMRKANCAEYTHHCPKQACARLDVSVFFFFINCFASQLLLVLSEAVAACSHEQLLRISRVVCSMKRLSAEMCSGHH